MTDPLEDVCFVLSLWELKVFSIHHTPHHNHLLSPTLPPATKRKVICCAWHSFKGIPRPFIMQLQTSSLIKGRSVNTF